jgi:hypothetical protein
MVEPDWAAVEDLDNNQLQAALLEYLDAIMVEDVPSSVEFGGGPDDHQAASTSS